MYFDWLKIIPMGISAVAAGFSFFYARESKRLGIKLVENKSDIELLSEVIGMLKFANATRKHSDNFSDEEFTTDNNLTKIPSKIATLVQNPAIEAIIDKNKWSLPIEGLENKIEQLTKARKELLK